MNILGKRNVLGRCLLLLILAIIGVVCLVTLKNNEVVDKFSVMMTSRDGPSPPLKHGPSPPLKHRPCITAHKSRSGETILPYADYYIQDQSGYIYHKDYFPLASPGVTPSFKDTDLRGRHSDTVLPPCEKFHTGAGADIGKQFDYRLIGPFNFSKAHKNPCFYEQSGRLRCVPYFYNIGTAKAGSSDLFSRQKCHPDIVKDVPKETGFFDFERFKYKHKQHFEFYLSLYDKMAVQLEDVRKKKGYSTQVVGDGTPQYSFNSVYWKQYPGNEGCIEPRVIVPSYIHHMLPQAKLIMTMRNPVDRLYSSFLFRYRALSKYHNTTIPVTQEFHRWAKRTIEAHRECFQKHPFRSCLYSQDLLETTQMKTAGSIYSRLIMDLLKIFPRKQMLFINLEEYKSNMPTQLQKIFDFLEVGPVSEEFLKNITNLRKSNVGWFHGKVGKMLPETRKMIYEFYKPFNEELAYLLNDTKYLWKEE